MANPKRKHSRSRRSMRRANWKASASNYSECPKCREVKLPHLICPSCGFYKDTLVIPKKEKKKKTDKQSQGEK